VAKRPMFGRPDPFSLLAVVPCVLIGVMLAFGNLASFAIIPVLLGGLILLFDSRANRPH
jgi:type IV secretory pathway VirB2 component (pilin)